MASNAEQAGRQAGGQAGGQAVSVSAQPHLKVFRGAQPPRQGSPAGPCGRQRHLGEPAALKIHGHPDQLSLQASCTNQMGVQIWMIVARLPTSLFLNHNNWLRTCVCRLPGHKLLKVGHPGLIKALRHSWVETIPSGGDGLNANSQQFVTRATAQATITQAAA